MKKVLTSLLIALLVLACAGCGIGADDAGKTSPGARVDANDADKGDNTASTMRLEKSEGSVSVSDENGKEQEAREKLPLFNGYEITTEATSYSWFNLDDTKLAKMDESSEASIEKEDKHLKLLVNKGSLYFNITEPLEDDETLEISTSSMTVGIRGTCGWVDADTNTVYLLRGVVACSSKEMSDEEVEIAEFMYAHCEEDGMIIPDFFEPTQIPQFVWDELDEEFFNEYGLSPDREDLFAVRDPEPEPEPEPEPDVDVYASKETAYRNGTTRVVAVTDTERHEFVYVNGAMSTAEYDDEDGKGGWGLDGLTDIRSQPYYGLTVEELVEKLQSQGYTVTINY